MTTVRQLIQEAHSAGVQLRLADGKVRLRGPSDAVAAVTEKLRPHRDAIAQYLAADVVGEFCPWVAPVSPEAVAELHTLIKRFAAVYQLSAAETTAIISAAKRQPAASVPGAVAWFKNQLSKESK